ncbi:MAG TPA: PilZ domain-containing protein [Nitrospirota bacterium]|nr:PilZ domain-containing protein [Nitrospirota bacterium]
MPIEAGVRVVFRLIAESTLHHATVVAIDDNAIVLEPEYSISADIPPGQYLLITGPDTDIEYYGEVIGGEGSALRLRRMWTGERGYFRVDDVFPFTWRKIPEGEPYRESCIFSGYGMDAADLELPDDSASPRLWKMLLDINAKLDVVIRHLHLESEGLIRARGVPVNLSASGLRFRLDSRPSIGDDLEVKILLPSYPPVGVLVIGRVVRIDEHAAAGFDISLHFIDLTDEVREVIIQYTLKRQREILSRQRRRE